MLTHQAKIAAKQVSDVYAFARLVALAEFLNTNHPQSGRHWRVNLLTGSNMQRALMEQWRQRNAAVGSVRLVHPLSAMGIDGFAQPDEGHSDQDTNEHHEAPGAYALRALKQKGSGDIDVEKFLNDFKDLLSSTAVSCAPNRERWMRNLRMELGGLDQHSRSVYLRSMRDAISRDFASTFAGLNIGLFNKKGQLLTVGLPALALPLEEQDPSPAQQFVMQLHGDSNETDPLVVRVRRTSLNPRLIPPVSKLIQADPTGYSALLCIGLGYLAQGRSSLRLAEAVANTAVAFATTDIGKDGEDDSYPQGNEALYFAAFVSRMQVDGSAAMRSHAHDWLQRHRTLLRDALAILEEWGKTDIGQRRVATSTSQANDTTLAQLVQIRYKAEQLAADVFGHLIDRLEITDSKLLVKPPIECLVVAKDLARQWSALNKLDLQPQYRADVTFVGAQLVAATIQAWLCVLADDPDGHIKDHEKWITKWVNDEALSNAAPGSMLVRVLIEIFNSRTRGGKPRKRDLMEAKRYLSQMQFSSLDELRGPLFKRLLDEPETPVSTLFRSQRSLDGAKLAERNPGSF